MFQVKLSVTLIVKYSLILSNNCWHCRIKNSMSVCTERIKMTWMQRLGKLSASMYSSKVQNDLKGGGMQGGGVEYLVPNLYICNFYFYFISFVCILLFFLISGVCVIFVNQFLKKKKWNFLNCQQIKIIDFHLEKIILLRPDMIFFFKYDFIIYNSILLHFWGKLFNKMKIHVK